MNMIFVGIGGFIGASARYLINIGTNKYLSNIFPYSTLFVNVIGCFFIGIVMESSLNYWNITERTKLFLTTGILGGLTTFSTFGYETINEFSKGRILVGSLNIILNVILCLGSVIAGKFLAGQMIKG